jgi:hypothetical protein
VKFSLTIPSRVLRRAAAVSVVLALAALGACSGNEQGVAGCPVLCPNQDLVLLDTTFEAVTLDTTLLGFPSRGTDSSIFLASTPDGLLDVRALVRYDSITYQYAPSLADTLRPITAPDSARLLLRFDTLTSKATAPFTIEAYDVDTAVVDTATAPLGLRFRPENLVASRTIPADSIRDSLYLPVLPAKLAQLLGRAQPRVRLGIRVRSAAPVYLRMGAVDASRPAQLKYRPAIDSGQPLYTFDPRSATPAGVPAVAATLADQTWTYAGNGMPPSDAIGVGGMPGRRAYLGFTIPSRIVDSTNVVRAQLLLTQRPVPGGVSTDTMSLYPYVVVGNQTSDLAAAATLALQYLGTIRQSAGQYSFTDSLRLTPADSGKRTIELTAVFREWRLSTPSGMRRAIVLKASAEGLSADELRFFSREAANAALRPKLRIVYTGKPGSPLP